MTAAIITDRDAAERYGKTLRFVQARCRGESPDWPHLRIGKSIRFTEAHLAWIDAHLERAAAAARPVEAPNTWGRKGRSA